MDLYSFLPRQLTDRAILANRQTQEKKHGVDYIATTLIRALVLAQGTMNISLQGKTFDLTSAYKQFPVHPSDRRHLRIAILEPGGGPRLFGMNSLPFGATGSVAGFLRVSAALFYILTVGFRVWCSAFFDDFPTVSSSSALQHFL